MLHKFKSLPEKEAKIEIKPFFLGSLSCSILAKEYNKFKSRKNQKQTTFLEMASMGCLRTADWISYTDKLNI